MFNFPLSLPEFYSPDPFLIDTLKDALQQTAAVYRSKE